MKCIKRAVAACLAAVLALTMVSCHEANEIAASYEDIEITSGMYLAMLLEADGAARNLVDEQNTDGDTIENYGKQKVKTDDGEVAFYDYVKDQTKKLIRQYIVTETMSKDLKVTLSEEDKSGIEAYVTYFWDTYGYGVLYTANGVNKDSYTTYLRNNGYLRANLFTAIYGKEGTDPISDSDLVEYMDKNYCIANVITESLSSTDESGNVIELSDEEAKELLQKLNDYATRLENGATFEEIYHEHSGTKHEDTEETAEETAEETTSDEEAANDQPIDSHATLLNSEEVGTESDNFEKIYAMKTGEIQVIETDASYSLVVKGDIDADPYYITSLDDTLRQSLKADEFNDMLDKEGKKLDIKYNTSEIRYLSPKKITYDVY